MGVAPARLHFAVSRSGLRKRPATFGGGPSGARFAAAGRDLDAAEPCWGRACVVVVERMTKRFNAETKSEDAAVGSDCLSSMRQWTCTCGGNVIFDINYIDETEQMKHSVATSASTST
jgi:hypothetical protein